MYRLLVCLALVMPPAAGSSGWLYVLDTNEYGGQRGDQRVLMVDPTSGEVRHVFPAGYNTDMALSPDGSRLYLAYSDKLSVIDTTTRGLFRTWPAPPARLTRVARHAPS